MVYRHSRVFARGTQSPTKTRSSTAPLWPSYARKHPLFHMAVDGTGSRVYCEDMDVLCADRRPGLELLLSDDFLSLRMALMESIFPDLEPLRLRFYRSSGHGQKYGHWKTQKTSSSVQTRSSEQRSKKDKPVGCAPRRSDAPGNQRCISRQGP